MVSYPSFFLANEEAIFEHLSTLEKLHLFQKTKRRSYEHIGRQALRLDRRSIAEKSLRALLDSKYSDLIFRIYLSVLYQDILLGQKQLEIEDGSDVNKLGAWVAFYYIDGQSITCKEVINFDEVFLLSEHLQEDKDFDEFYQWVKIALYNCNTNTELIAFWDFYKLLVKKTFLVDMEHASGSYVERILLRNLHQFFIKAKDVSEDSVRVEIEAFVFDMVREIEKSSHVHEFEKNMIEEITNLSE